MADSHIERGRAGSGDPACTPHGGGWEWAPRPRRWLKVLKVGGENYQLNLGWEIASRDVPNFGPRSGLRFTALNALGFV